MLKEIKYVIYLLTIFFYLFFVVKFYISENNIKRTNKIMFHHQNEIDKKFTDLPIIKNDTTDIIEYTNEIEEFKKKKKRLFWGLLEPNEK